MENEEATGEIDVIGSLQLVSFSLVMADWLAAVAAAWACLAQALAYVTYTQCFQRAKASRGLLLI
jgi:hypothetical protein